MLKIKAPIFTSLICLFALPLLACAMIQNLIAPTPTPTNHPSATGTAKPAVPTATPISLTQAARRTEISLTRAATRRLPTNTPTSTNTPAPTRTRRITNTPSLTVTATVEFPRMDYVSIAAPALSNNMLGESSPRDLLIYIPTSYGQPAKHYPVVYYLLDFGIQIKDVAIPIENIQKDVAVGLSKEMIIVFVSGTNSLGGSFYVNSPVTGNWDDFITQDVVGYVDAHYRSIPKASARGISGYAVGGFGALSVAMRHPDVFGAVYSLSPTLFDVDGLAASPMFSVQPTVDSVIDLLVREMSLSVSDGISAMQHAGDAQFSVAYGATFVANPQGKPPYMDYPYYRQNGRIFRDDTIWKRWEAGFGNIPDKVQQYKENLRKLSITLACGENAPYIWMLQGCRSFSTEMNARGIPHQLFTFPGQIEPDLEQGIRGYALPFFAEKLVFEP